MQKKPKDKDSRGVSKNSEIWCHTVKIFKKQYAQFQSFYITSAFWIHTSVFRWIPIHVHLKTDVKIQKAFVIKKLLICAFSFSFISFFFGYRNILKNAIYDGVGNESFLGSCSALNGRLSVHFVYYCQQSWATWYSDHQVNRSTVARFLIV